MEQGLCRLFREVYLLLGDPPVLLLLKKVTRQFIFIDLDEGDLASWLAETVMSIHVAYLFGPKVLILGDMARDMLGRRESKLLEVHDLD